MASSMYISSILVLLDSTSLKVAMLPWIRVCTVLDSSLTDLADSAHHLDYASPSFVSSGSGARDPVPGNGVGSAEWMASSKYISSILVLSDFTTFKVAILPWIRVYTVLDSSLQI